MASRNAPFPVDHCTGVTLAEPPFYLSACFTSTSPWSPLRPRLPLCQATPTTSLPYRPQPASSPGPNCLGFALLHPTVLHRAAVGARVRLFSLAEAPPPPVSPRPKLFPFLLPLLLLTISSLCCLAPDDHVAKHYPPLPRRRQQLPPRARPAVPIHLGRPPGKHGGQQLLDTDHQEQRHPCSAILVLVLPPAATTVARR